MINAGDVDFEVGAGRAGVCRIEEASLEVWLEVWVWVWLVQEEEGGESNCHG